MADQSMGKNDVKASVREIEPMCVANGERQVIGKRLASNEISRRRNEVLALVNANR